MNTRRSFLSGVAAGKATAFLGETPTVRAATASNTVAANSVHTSFARILVKHLKVQLANPRHSPFSSAEISTAFRMHCDALQASGHNDTVTAALRQATTISSLSAVDLDGHYATLAKLGVQPSGAQNSTSRNTSSRDHRPK